MLGVQVDMTLEYGRGADLCIAHLYGELDLLAVPKVQSAVDEALATGCRNVVLDLTHVTYADSSSFSLLVYIDRRLEPKQGRLVLAGATAHVSRILELSGLIGVAPTIAAATDVGSAVAGFDVRSPSANPQWTEHLSISASPESLPAARERVATILQPLGLDEGALFDIRVAVGEALANAVRHGSPRGADDVVSVTVNAYPDRVAISVRDAGCGYDGCAAPGSDLYAASGRGVLFMRSLMDRVEFASESDGGTCVTMVKHLAAASGTTVSKG